MTRAVTRRELAAVLPNNRGGRGVHIRTIDRRVERGELPPADLSFADGTRLWYLSTLHEHGIRAELFSDTEAAA